MFSNYSEVLTLDEVRGILRIGRNKMYYLIKSGKIPSFGKPARVLKQSLIDYINSELYGKS